MLTLPSVHVGLLSKGLIVVPFSAQYAATSGRALSGSSASCLTAGLKNGLSGVNIWSAGRDTPRPMSSRILAFGVAYASAWRTRTSSNGGFCELIIWNDSSAVSSSKLVTVPLSLRSLMAVWSVVCRASRPSLLNRSSRSAESGTG